MTLREFTDALIHLPEKYGEFPVQGLGVYEILNTVVILHPQFEPQLYHRASKKWFPMSEAGRIYDETA